MLESAIVALMGNPIYVAFVANPVWEIFTLMAAKHG